MTDLTLQRLTQTEDGTIGALCRYDRPLCWILEDPWNDNQVGISCIPAATYLAEKYSGTKYKDVWILQDVPGRSAILIHAGNTEDDTRGCLLPGMQVGVLQGKPAVLASRAAMGMLRQELPEKFTLEIINPT